MHRLAVLALLLLSCNAAEKADVQRLQDRIDTLNEIQEQHLELIDQLRLDVSLLKDDVMGLKHTSKTP